MAVAAALIGLIVFMGRDEPQAENQPVTERRGPPPAAAGSEGVKTFPVAGRDHIQPSQQPDNWNSTADLRRPPGHPAAGRASTTTSRTCGPWSTTWSTATW